MPRIWKPLIATAAAGALALTLSPSASAATSAQPAAESSSTSDVALKYSTRDVISFFMLATGPLMESHPELAENLGLLNHDVDDATIDAFVAEILEMEPNFEARITEPIQSGDPVRAQAALEDLTKLAKQYVAEHQSQEQSGVTPQGTTTNITTTINVLWGALVVAAAGVAVAGALFVVLYEPTNSSTRFESDLRSLDVATAL